MKKIWIIDDEPTICWALRKELQQAGFSVSVFGSSEECLETIRGSAALPDVVLLDVRLPGKSGLDLLGTLHQLPSAPAVIVMTAFGDLKVAVEAVRGRAFEYLTKPFDLATMLGTVRRAAESVKAIPHRVGGDASAAVPPDTMLGDSPAMQSVYKQIAIAAPSDAPVLIDGESGTGKSLVARMIHRFSARAADPLVFFRPDEDHMTESDAELFGTCLPSAVAGSASGPNKQPGLMFLAGKGTLVVEEVALMSIAAQAKLLSAIESGSFQAIASAEPDPFRGRLVFTSSFDLEGACNDGGLYEPLAAQMRVIHIHLPPLRERCEDVRGLANAFLAMASPDSSKRFSDQAIQILETQPWPGNVRQLKQTIQYAAVHARGSVVNPDDLPPLPSTSGRDSVPGAVAESGAGSTASQLEQATRAWLSAHGPQQDSEDEAAVGNAGFLYEEFLAVAERALIEAMLQACGGNRASVASRLGIHRTTLRQKMKRYGL